MSTISLAVYSRILNDGTPHLITFSEALRIAYGSGHSIGIYASPNTPAREDVGVHTATEVARGDIGLVYIILDL